MRQIVSTIAAGALIFSAVPMPQTHSGDHTEFLGTRLIHVSTHLGNQFRTGKGGHGPRLKSEEGPSWHSV